MPELNALIEAANDLATLLEAGSASKHQLARDKATRRAYRKIQKLARDRFRAQRKAILDSHGLKTLHDVLDRAGHVQESEAEDRERLETDIAAALGTQVYTLPVTADQQETFARAITTAIDNGGTAAADMLSTEAPDTESFIAEYLKDGGFARLTGDIDQTTVNDLAKAVADAYESGADFDGVVQAVKDSFVQASSFRAKMIAQTELNDAWNQSLMHFGEQAGATKKSWVVDAAPCPICIENALDGEIDFADDFGSGDDAPPAHPNCSCSLMVHA